MLDPLFSSTTVTKLEQGALSPNDAPSTHIDLLDDKIDELQKHLVSHPDDAEAQQELVEWRHTRFNIFNP